MKLIPEHNTVLIFAECISAIEIDTHSFLLKGELDLPGMGVSLFVFPAVLKLQHSYNSYVYM